MEVDNCEWVCDTRRDLKYSSAVGEGAQSNAAVSTAARMFFHCCEERCKECCEGCRKECCEEYCGNDDHRCEECCKEY